MPLRHTGFPPAETSLALKWPEQSREQELVQGDSLQQQPPAQMRFKHAPATHWFPACGDLLCPGVA